MEIFRKEYSPASDMSQDVKPPRRSERKPKAEIIKAELETIASFLSVTDDSKHGIEAEHINVASTASAACRQQVKLRQN